MAHGAAWGSAEVLDSLGEIPFLLAGRAEPRFAQSLAVFSAAHREELSLARFL